MPVIVVLHVLPPALFALLHGAIRYGIRGILAFVAVCLVVGNVSENLGIRTGFPFGHYYFTDLIGPSLLHVPILLGLAYVGMGYLCWTLGGLIVGEPRSLLTRSPVLTVPLVSSFLFYGVSAAGNLALIPRAGLSVVSDPSGTPWRVANIVAASALISIFTMGHSLRSHGCGSVGKAVSPAYAVDFAVYFPIVVWTPSPEPRKLAS